MPCTVARFLAVIAALMCAAHAPPGSQPSLPFSDLLEETWQVVNDNFYDVKFNGADWPAARDRCRARSVGVTSMDGAAREINVMLDELKTSHTHLYVPGEIAYY